MPDTENSLAIIGVPLDLGAENLGVSMGPDTFRYQGIGTKLTDAGFNVRDQGNVTVKDRRTIKVGDSKLRHMDEIIRVSEATAELVHECLEHREKVVVLGGDHSVCLGAVSGASKQCRGKLGLVYLDAHGDLNTADTTLTGNIHGMHLASLLGFGTPALVNVYAPGAKIAKANLLHIGGSDFDPAERELIKREQLHVFTLFDLLTSTLAPLLRSIDGLRRHAPQVWVSLDLDVIDALYAPGAGMPNQKGLSYREITTIASYIGQRCNVVGVDVVEYNPLQDQQGKTAELAIELIAALFGKEYSWYTHYLDKNRL